MGDEKINVVLDLYDEYLNSLRHISGFNIDVDKVNRINRFASLQEIDKFLRLGLSDLYSELMNSFVNKMLGIVNFRDVSDLKTFIYYPDFKVETFINNPSNMYNRISSLEKTLIVCPVYELNLAIKSCKYRLEVLRLMKIALSPKIDILLRTIDSVDKNACDYIERDLTSRFKLKYGSAPSSDDLILLRSIAIKYIFENEKDKKAWGIESINQIDAYVCYEHGGTRKIISDEYGVYYNDSYKSISKVETPWIYRELAQFDNRQVMPKQDNKPLPLTYMRKRQ